MKLEFYCDGMRHLVCTPYSVGNLHEMARQLGIKRCWFHKGKKPHYDIPKMLRRDIMDKCKVVSEREILKIIKDGMKVEPKQNHLDL